MPASQGILCQGRGSAANSAVCYCLGVTSVDPDRIDVLFERFICKERDEAPDIDIDFEHQRREEVIQYVYEKYGRDRAGMTAEVITYRPRSAVRDVGKALGLSLDRVDALAKAVGHVETGDELHHPLPRGGPRPGQPAQPATGPSRAARSWAFPAICRSTSAAWSCPIRRCASWSPIENASMPGRTVIQWDKDDLDALGILKVDCLALGMLSAIRRASTCSGNTAARR